MDKARFFLGCTFTVLLVSSALATPVWRGMPGSTYQMWDFSTPDNPASPEVVENPYGGPLADITVTGDIHGIEAGWYQTFLGREGVWHGETTDILLSIPNTDILNDYKEIWLEVGFRGDLVGTELMTDPPGTVIQFDPTYDYTPDGWQIMTIGWRIEPNPFFEQIRLTFQNSGADVDYIIADTICIPEPTTICLLGLGGLTLLRKRRS